MRAIFVVLAVIGLVLAGASLRPGSDTPVAEAAIYVLNVTMVGQQENPPVSGDGHATAHFTFNDATRVLTYSVWVQGISPSLVTASHIHRGAVGVNGPIVYTLSATAFSNVSGSITLTPEDVADLTAGRFYVNVHSIANPGGFARAQMLLPAGVTAPAAPAALPTTAPATPARIAPPSTGDAGLATTTQGSMLLLAGLVLATGAGSLTLARRRA
jgi:hypothetical protein